MPIPFVCHSLILVNSARISPNHIAFLAEDRNIVRECYAAALNSGGHPSGAPNYRNENCTCFNAAVEDLDGNTIEFIFRQPHGDGGCCGEAGPQSSIQDLEDADEVAEDDVQSIAQSVRSQESRVSRAKSSMQTALDLASTTSKSIKSAAPSQGISRTNTAPASSSFPSRTLVGTALGAAAGAALMYAMSRAERASAKDEAEHAAYMMSSKPRSRSETRGIQRESRSMPPPPPPSLKTRSIAARSAAPISYPAPPSVRDTRKFHRNFSTTESAFSTRHPAPHSTQAMRMLEATGHNGVDSEVQEALGRYNSLRAMPTRSKTSDDYIYAATSQAGARSETRRASKMPVRDEHEPLQYMLEEGPRSTVSRGSKTHRDSGMRSSSHVSSSASRHRRVSHDDAAQLHHRNDSGVSVHSSSRSHHRRERDGESETGRTIKPATTPSRRDSALPSPPSKPPSLLIETAAYFPAAISLPASSIASSSRRRNAAIPPIHHSEQSWEEFTAGEESDGLGDIKTVVPEDSISCVDLSEKGRRRRRKGGSESGRSSHHRHGESESGRSSRHHHGSSSRKHGSSSSRRSEAASESTVKPIKRGSVVAEGKGRIFGF